MCAARYSSLADSGEPVSDIVITSNVTLGVDNPPDPGVAVWFAWDGMTVCIPVDRYSSTAANLQAIHHVLEARRVELRHGSCDDIDRAIDELFLDTAAVEVGGALLVAQTYLILDRSRLRHYQHYPGIEDLSGGTRAVLTGIHTSKLSKSLAS
jgi:hypothetical protein